MEQPEAIVKKALAILLVPMTIGFFIFAPVEYWKPMLGATALCVAYTIMVWRLPKKLSSGGGFLMIQILAFLVIFRLFGIV